MKEKCCGTCKYHHHDKDMLDGDWMCFNGDSVNVADWTDYEDSCGEWEERE